MNLELLGAIVVLTVLVVGYILVMLRPLKNKSDKYIWQPDLSHKVIVLDAPPISQSHGREQRILLIEKTPEERAEDRRAFLKEK